MARFTFTSGRLIERLNQVRQEFSGKKAAARLSVSPENSWWYYHEFGTATHFNQEEVEVPPSVTVTEPEGTANGNGYPIPPKDAGAIRLPIGGGYTKALIVPQIGAEYTLEHPGVEPKAMVRHVLPEIHETAVTGVMQALKSGGYKFDPVQEALISQVMPKVLEAITQSIGELMDGASDRDTPGKLKGQPPADAFAAGASIAAAPTE